MLCQIRNGGFIVESKRARKATGLNVLGKAKILVIESPGPHTRSGGIKHRNPGRGSQYQEFRIWRK